MRRATKGFVTLYLCLLLPMAAEAAVDVDYATEFTRKIQAAQAIAPLGEDLFGDTTDWYTGQTQFRVVDIDLPGNNALPVQVARRHSTAPPEYYPQAPALLGNWELDIPYMSGVFATGVGWKTSLGGTNRCSAPTSASSAAPPGTVYSGAPFDATEYWRGNSVSIPGRGNQMLLWPDAANTSKPVGGPTYRWATVDHTWLSCLTTLANGQPGEGFMAQTPDGHRYYFNWLITRPFSNFVRARLNSPGSDYLPRQEVRLYATRVEDRFGNYVNYTYSGEMLTSIESSDGRLITLTYNAQNKLQTATASSRTWTYSYSGSNYLIDVALPDSRHWTFTQPDLDIKYTPTPASSLCNLPPYFQSGEETWTMTHPSGATGTFVFNPFRHTRTQITTPCRTVGTPGEREVEPGAPRQFDTYVLTRKTLSGPGLTATTWTASYGATVGDIKTITLTKPDAAQTRYTFGTEFYRNEGKTLRIETLNSSATVIQDRQTTYAVAPVSPPYAYRAGSTGQAVEDAFGSTLVTPATQNTITRLGDSFRNTVITFDGFARPTSVTRASTLVGGSGYSQSETLGYHDNNTLWVLGQESQRVIGGTTVAATTFDLTNALPLTYTAFNKLQQTLTWDTTSTVASGQRGTVLTVKDGNNQITTASNWKRGIPQSLVYADSASESAVVNDSGWIDSVADENGYKTCYAYDVMGRLSQITYPSEVTAGVCNNSTWNVTTQLFEPVASVEYGIPAGHWRQTVSTGNGRKISYFDALWRPLLTREYDTANLSGTQRFQRFGYDYQGRVTFSSYPGTTDALTTGTRTVFDALDRPTQVTQDSELGVLTTTTAYLDGFRSRVTDPKGNQTTTSFMAYDQPTTDWPILMAHPEGAYTHITRDPFGKPTQLRRSNSSNPTGGTLALDRTYKYNLNQELCRSVEPETGTTLMGYDAAGNLKWSAAGLVSGTDCETNGTSPAVAARRVDRTYDPRNRLSALSFPDGLGNQTWTYTTDGLPDTITTYNAASNGQSVVNGYSYNRRRLLTAETSTTEGTTWSLGYGYNANAHLTTQTYPSTLSVSYAPNALGQPTQVGSFATAVSYYPSGAVQQFSYGNGIVHTMTQNARQLPSRIIDCTTSGTCTSPNLRLDLSYIYDLNGNTGQITDAIDGRQSRGMSYDGLDRLTGTTSTAFSTATYTYNQIDNLTRVQIGGTQTRDHGYCYTNNRLTTVKASTCSGSTLLSLGYDVQGNLSTKGSQGYSFDYGNRLRSATGLESYRYDGLGRRVYSQSTAGILRTEYSQSGTLLYAENARTSKRTDYLYLQGKLIAQRERPTASSTETFRYLHTDLLGSPIAATDASKAFVEKSEFEPYGQVINRPLRDGPGYTDHMEDAATGLNYMQQRYYDSGLGLFLSVDPITAYANPIGQFHRYRYANNNPYTFIDPTGMCGSRIKDNSAVNCRTITFRGEDNDDNGYKGKKKVSPSIVQTNASTARDLALGNKQEMYGGIPPIELIVVARGINVYINIIRAILRPKADEIVTSEQPTQLQQGKLPRKPGSLGEFKGRDALRAENNQPRDAAKAAGLSKGQAERFHLEISGQDYSYDELLRIANEMKYGK